MNTSPPVESPRVLTTWDQEGAPREFLQPRAIWYVRCWCHGTRIVPSLGWFGMHATVRESMNAMERTR